MNYLHQSLWLLAGLPFLSFSTSVRLIKRLAATSAESHCRLPFGTRLPWLVALLLTPYVGRAITVDWNTSKHQIFQALPSTSGQISPIIISAGTSVSLGARRMGARTRYMPGAAVRTATVVATASQPRTTCKHGETRSVLMPTTVTTAKGLLTRKRVSQLSTPGGGTGVGNFVAPHINANPAVGHHPCSVAVGDVDGDGDLDLLTANSGNTVSVRLNDGTGNFTPPASNPNPAVGNFPLNLAVGDVDGDGDLDLVAATSAKNTISVRLNDGRGNFTPPATNPEPVVGSSPSNLALGDMDRDGDLDLVAVNGNNNEVYVVLNDGTGNFTKPATDSRLGMGEGPHGVALSDVDGDGDLDLLTANFTSNDVSLRFNDGKANFTLPLRNPEIAVGTSPRGLVMGDVDGDGDLDLLTANSDSNTISVRLNDGTGNFTPPATNPNPAVGDSPYSLAVGDVDGDSDLDLLAANTSSNTVSVRLNDGRGNFTPPTSNPEATVSSDPESIALGDVDGDGDLDLLTTCSNGYEVSVRLNQGPAPTISQVSPVSGVAGTRVRLTGTNLTGASRVLLDGVAVTPMAITSTSLVFVVPAGTSSVPVLLVTTPCGNSAVSTAFTVRLHGVAFRRKGVKNTTRPDGK